MKNNNNFNEAVAPYNFVGLPSKLIERYKSFDELPAHDQYDPKLNHGYIEYMLEADSPFLVGGESKKENNETHKFFFKNLNGKTTVPGSSMRGLIRSNATILSLSSPIDDIQDQLFLYRGLADKSKKLREEYTNHIDIRLNHTSNSFEPGKVKAGYVYQKTKDEYVIIPAKHEKGKTFFKISEMQLRRLNINNRQINFMYTEKILDFKRNKYGNKNDELKRWEKHLKLNQNRSFKPYTTKISFQLKVDNNQVSIKDINIPGKLTYNGFLLCSGFMQKKNSHYIINEIDKEGREIILRKEEIRAYNEDLIRKKLKENSFYNLPDKLGIQHAIPIFYADEGERNYFGFTPYLRVFYNGTVHDGIPAHLKEEKLDYVKSLFGFVNKDSFSICKTKKSYKSRVSFTDAVLSGEEKSAKVEKVVLGEPKATCFPQYLSQPQTHKDHLLNYNDKGEFRIRGIKQYWLQKKVNPQCANKPNVDAYLHPVDKGTTFKGKIYFYNLTIDELGLLLWSLRLEDGCKHNIGTAKPYGYGKIIIKDIDVHIENINKKYQSLSFNFFDKEDTNLIINKYKAYLKENFDINIEDEKAIKEFIAMKKNELDVDKTRYMSINNSNNYPRNEFAERVVLPNPFEVLNGNSQKTHNSNNRNQQREIQTNQRKQYFTKPRKNNQSGNSNTKQVYKSTPNTGEKTPLQIAMEEARKRKK